MILPMMITLVLGGIDFGRFAYAYIAVTNAARVGAGFGSSRPFTAASQPTWEQRIRQAVVDEMGSSFDRTKIVVPAPTVLVESDGQKRLRVEVGYPFTTLIDWPALPQSVMLRQAVEMRLIH